MFLFWDSISSDVTNSFKWVYFMWIQTRYASDIYLYTAVYIENHYKWSNVFTIKQINLTPPQWIRLSNTIAATPFLVCIPVPHTSISLTTLHWLSSKISLVLCVLKISSTWYPSFFLFFCDLIDSIIAGLSYKFELLCMHRNFNSSFNDADF